MSILCLGPEVPRALADEQVIHCPLIEIQALAASDPDIAEAITSWQDYTHLIFTSKTAVDLAAALFKLKQCQGRAVIAVGEATADRLRRFEVDIDHIATQETAEGVVAVLDSLDLSDARILWPRSALARPVITNYLEDQNIRFDAPPIYNTVPCTPDTLPPLDAVTTIYFSSPSTVDGFLRVYGEIPSNKTIRAIGPITRQRLTQVTERH